MALQLVDTAGGGEVTLISMVPNGEVSGLRTALAMGAAKAILVSDDALAGSDALVDREGARQVRRARAATSTSCSPRPSRPTATPARCPRRSRELLGWPSLTFAKHVEIADGKVKIQRQTEAGYDVVEASLPAVVSVTAGVVEPRYPSFKGIMAAKNKPVDTGDRGRSRPRRVAGRLGRCAPGDHERRRRRPRARPARSSKTTEPAPRRSLRSSSS